MKTSLKVKEIAHHAHREVAFLKNRIYYYTLAELIILAVIGLFSQFILRSSRYLKGIDVMIVISCRHILLGLRFVLQTQSGKT